MRRQKDATPEGDTHKSVNELTPIQLRFIEYLLAGKNLSEAALLAGVSRRAACYWMNDTESVVHCEYERLRQAQQQEFQARVTGLHDLAFKALEDSLKSPVPGIKFAAAKLIYEAKLQERCETPAAHSSLELVRDFTRGYYDEQYQWRVLGPALYDTKNKERILDD